MGEHPLGTEPFGHCRTGQRGELAERRHTELA
ncbi:hypothetical protein HRbin41_01448 [bacterium HR41]|nr:hypothetical protein HRbin41_01448 [bacterium HR41]